MLCPEHSAVNRQTLRTVETVESRSGEQTVGQPIVDDEQPPLLLLGWQTPFTHEKPIPHLLLLVEKKRNGVNNNRTNGAQYACAIVRQTEFVLPGMHGCATQPLLPQV
jgi:hypothetical protein